MYRNDKENWIITPAPSIVSEELFSVVEAKGKNEMSSAY